MEDKPRAAALRLQTNFKHDPTPSSIQTRANPFRHAAMRNGYKLNGTAHSRDGLMGFRALAPRLRRCAATLPFISHEGIRRRARNVIHSDFPSFCRSSADIKLR